jgi:hypothetical protein
VEEAVDGEHLGNGRRAGGADEDIAQFAEEAADGAVVDKCFSAVEIAEGLEYAVGLSFEQEPGVVEVGGFLKGDGETEFEGHVEAGGSRMGGVKLDAREIVEGVVRGGD